MLITKIMDILREFLQPNTAPSPEKKMIIIKPNKKIGQDRPRYQC